MNLLKLILGGLLCVAIGVGIGYYISPDHVKEETKTDKSKETKSQDDTTVTKEYDPQTGKVIKEITKKTHKDDVKKETETDKIVEKSKDQKHYAIKAGPVFALTKAQSPFYRAGAEVRLPFFNSWLGAETDLKLKPDVGVYLRLEF